MELFWSEETSEQQKGIIQELRNQINTSEKENSNKKSKILALEKELSTIKKNLTRSNKRKIYPNQRLQNGTKQRHKHMKKNRNN